MERSERKDGRTSRGGGELDDEGPGDGESDEEGSVRLYSLSMNTGHGSDFLVSRPPSLFPVRCVFRFEALYSLIIH